jgi:segregation and condensation protein B
MSLKAKLEAVIYAAEEPVTLAQLAALFADEAWEWKAAQAAASVASEGETVPLLNAELEFEQLEEPADAAAPSASQSASPSPADPSSAPDPEPVAVSSESVSGEVAEVPAPSAPVVEAPADLEAEAKRVARQRDREVRTILRGLLDELIGTYASDDRGIEIKEIAGGYRMATKPECHDAARMFVKSLKPALKLSLPALETLAVVAYKQPVTAPEVNEIRGVESSGVFGSLLARKLIATAGRKQVIGRPILYKTTKEFLLRFGLKDVTELPSMEEFEKMAQLEFDEPEPVTEDASAASETSPDALGDASPEIDFDPDSDPEAPGPKASGAETAADAQPTSELLSDPEASSAEAEPAEPSPSEQHEPDQKETESVPHD